MSSSDLPKLWTTFSNISKFVHSKSFFCVKNWLNLSKKTNFMKNIWLGDQLLVKKILQESKLSKSSINISWSPNQIFFTEKKIWKDSTNFRHWKMTLKVRILQSLTRLFIILVSLRMSLFSEKMLIFNRCISGLMSNLIKKSWTVSSPCIMLFLK